MKRIPKRRVSQGIREGKRVVIVDGRIVSRAPLTKIQAINAASRILAGQPIASALKRARRTDG